MSHLLDALTEALSSIARLDPDLLSAIVATLKVSLASTLCASTFALPLGFLLAGRSFPGKRAVLALLKTALALPTVVVAIFVYAFIAARAPLGGLKLLFTPAAIVVGQTILITPLITALVHGALAADLRTVYEEALLLGASPFAAFRKTLREAKIGITTAIMAGFGRVTGEIGISLILGGNIRGFTRTITTAMALETSQGRFSHAVALGIVLLSLVLLVNLGIQVAGGET